MARQIRSTSAIIARLALVIGSLVLIHVVARLLHMWGMLAVHETRFIKTPEFTGHYKAPISFWNMDVSTFYLGWPSLIIVYIAAVLCILAAVGIIAGLTSAFKWLVFQTEDDPGCQDKHCQCVEHRGKVFYEDGQFWGYPRDSSDNLALGIAVGVATGVAVGAASRPS